MDPHPHSTPERPEVTVSALVTTGGDKQLQLNVTYLFAWKFTLTHLCQIEYIEPEAEVETIVLRRLLYILLKAMISQIDLS